MLKSSSETSILKLRVSLSSEEYIHNKTGNTAELRPTPFLDRRQGTASLQKYVDKIVELLDPRLPVHKFMLFDHFNSDAAFEHW